MKRLFSILLAVLGVAALVLVWGIGGYNSLVRDNEDIDGQWAQVENQFQRRYDLIPNLVATVKGYAQHEEDVFKAVADARAKLGGAGTVDDRAAAVF